MARTSNKLAEIVFQCSKCYHHLILDISNEKTPSDIINSLLKISRKECPNCGEEAYVNWRLDSVKMKGQNKQ